MSIRFDYLYKNVLGTLYSKREINEAVKTLLYAYPYDFRKRTHIILTQPEEYTYFLPANSINRTYTLRNTKLSPPSYIESEDGRAVIFAKTLFKDKQLIICDYITTSIGTSNAGNEIMTLRRWDDAIDVPTHLAGLFADTLKTYMDFQRSCKNLARYSGVKDKEVFKLGY